MDIRKWFCSESASSTEVDRCFNSLLELYAEALSKYFFIFESSNIKDFIKEAKKSQLTEEQQLFLNWFEECGFPTLQSVLSKELPNDPDLVAQIEYEHYILSEELDYGSPEDIRAALVNIIVDLPTRIESAATASETIYELYEYTADYVGIFSEVFYNPTSVFSSMPNKDIIEDTLPIRQGFLLSEGICSTDVECLKQFLMMGGIHNYTKNGFAR